MGTSMTFYLIENRALTLETLRKRMEAFRMVAWKQNVEQAEQFELVLSQFLDMDRFEEIKDQMCREDPVTFAKISKLLEKEKQPKKIISFPGTDWTEPPQWISANGERRDVYPKRKGPVLAWRADAMWLPLFEESFCSYGSDIGAEEVSKAFGAPVLAFYIFDSDILFLSYRDPERKLKLDFAQPNDFRETEEIGAPYQMDFPTFLCTYGDEQTLRKIWEGEEVFADDRMLKLCQAIGAQVLYDVVELPEGYERVE